MSSNVYKSGLFYGNQQPADKRIIDTNELVATRLETLAEILKKKEAPSEESVEGFVEGLQAEDVSGMLAEGGDEGGSVIKAGQAESSAALKRIQEEVNEMLANARKQADVIVSEALEQAELSKKNVLEEARMNGYREGINRANKEVEGIKADFEKQKAALEAEYEDKLETMEMDLVEVITGIYEHIFHVELSSYREILVHLISTTMRKVEGSKSFIIHVSKDDYPFVSMQKKQLVARVATSSNAVDIVEDLTLAKGQCIIEADGGIFDCGLGTQLKDLRKKLQILSYEN